MESKKLVLIFTRNPELGKCKTRLAATIGDQAALESYIFLLKHTVSITKGLCASKHVYYSEAVIEDDLWDTTIYSKYPQKGMNLGERMCNAFADGFEQGYEKIIIIGSDMYDLSQSDIEHAFDALEAKNYVLGPAEDGGYYLFGMKSLNSQVFKDKQWGTDTVLSTTLNDLKNETFTLLEERNDIDYYEDIKDIDVFQKILLKYND